MIDLWRLEYRARTWWGGVRTSYGFGLRGFRCATSLCAVAPRAGRLAWAWGRAVRWLELLDV